MRGSHVFSKPLPLANAFKPVLAQVGDWGRRLSCAPAPRDRRGNRDSSPMTRRHACLAIFAAFAVDGWAPGRLPPFPASASRWESTVQASNASAPWFQTIETRQKRAGIAAMSPGSRIRGIRPLSRRRTCGRAAYRTAPVRPPAPCQLRQGRSHADILGRPETRSLRADQTGPLPETTLVASRVGNAAIRKRRTLGQTLQSVLEHWVGAAAGARPTIVPRFAGLALSCGAQTHSE